MSIAQHISHNLFIRTFIHKYAKKKRRKNDNMAIVKFAAYYLIINFVSNMHTYLLTLASHAFSGLAWLWPSMECVCVCVFVYVIANVYVCLSVFFLLFVLGSFFVYCNILIRSNHRMVMPCASAIIFTITTKRWNLMRSYKFICYSAIQEANMKWGQESKWKQNTLLRESRCAEVESFSLRYDVTVFVRIACRTAF